MNSDSHAELTKLLKDWGQAIISNDAEQIGRFATDDWVIVGETGLFERGQFLAAIEAGDLTHEAFEVDVARVRTYGDTAVVTAHVTNNGTWQGQPFTADEWSTDVYVKQGNGWLCAHTQLTPRAKAQVDAS
jgi:ketosteroid isomerase-like protein